MDNLHHLLFGIKRGLVIQGPIESGKTRLAKSLIPYFKDAIMLDAKRNKANDIFAFCTATKNTSLVILDDLSDIGFLNMLLSGSLKIEKQSQTGFFITPYIIATMRDELKVEPNPRFNVIHL